MTVVPHPPYFSPFPLLKMKLRGHHFDTAEVIEVESQDAFKNGRRAGNGAYTRGYFEVDGG
jgi:hypothetical protein